MSTIFQSGWESSSTDITDGGKWSQDTNSNPHPYTDIWYVTGYEYIEGAHSIRFSYPLTYWSQDYALDSNSLGSSQTIGLRFGIKPITINTTTNGALFALSVGQPGPTSNFAFALFPIETVSHTQAFSLYSLGSGFSGGGPYLIGSYAYTTNTWYQIELLWISNISLQLKVWDGHGTTNLYTSSVYTTHVVAGTAQFLQLGGQGSNVGQVTYFLDAVIADNAGFPGPLNVPKYGAYYPLPSSRPNY
jgi:hypothetical protein